MDVEFAFLARSVDRHDTDEGTTLSVQEPGANAWSIRAFPANLGPLALVVRLSLTPAEHDRGPRFHFVLTDDSGTGVVTSEHLDQAGMKSSVEEELHHP